MKGLKPEELQHLILSVGTHRKNRPLSPYECGQLFDKARRMGNSLKECAEAVGISDTGTIANFIRLLDIVPSHSHLVDWGKTGSTIAFKSAAILAKLNPADQEIAFIAALEKRLIKIEVEQILQIRQRSGRDIVECIDEVVGMRPVTTTVNVIIGAIDDDNLPKKLFKLKQNEKDKLLYRAIRSNFPNLQKFSARLGNEQFTISVSDEDADYLSTKGEGMEEKISKTISALI